MAAMSADWCTLAFQGPGAAHEGSVRAFEYLAWSWKLPWGRRRHMWLYEGDLCPLRGIPHGWGTWSDDHPHGEWLQGWWENGTPVGPFHSSTVDLGYAFSCVQLAVCTNRLIRT